MAGAFVTLILVHIVSVGYLINEPSQDPLPSISNWNVKINDQQEIVCNNLTFQDRHGGNNANRYIFNTNIMYIFVFLIS